VPKEKQILEERCIITEITKNVIDPSVTRSADNIGERYNHAIVGKQRFACMETYTNIKRAHLKNFHIIYLMIFAANYKL
jgi:hypothetical protein